MRHVLTWAVVLASTAGAGLQCEVPSRLEVCRRSGVCVDCEAVCSRMAECQVTFSVEEPPLADAVLPGDAQSRCERGCLSTDTITAERQDCILATDPADPNRCQQEVVGCLGVDGGAWD